MLKLKNITLLMLALVATVASAADDQGLNQGAKSVEKGWFYFETKPQEPEVEPAPLPAPTPKQTQPQTEDEKKKCSKKETWGAACGFINPGQDFQFQAKQRDALMERMSVSPNDPKAVENFQYYMKWVNERVAEVTNLWAYNMAQNPDLDPSVKAPVSAFGLRLMSEVQKGQDAELFGLIKREGGFLVYFSRSDCKFCHDMAPALAGLAKQSGLEVRNASLDGKCIEGFETGCMKAPETLSPARALQVSTVPAVFLYVPSNTWLRISTGITDGATLRTRVTQFFGAYRNALLTGVNNGQGIRPSVDFTGTGATGVTKGVESEKSAQPRLPTEADIASLLGKRN